MTFLTVERSPKLQENRHYHCLLSGHGDPLLNMRSVLALVLLVGGCVPCVWGKDIALVTNKSAALPAIAMADLVKICKGQMNRWPDGKPVTLVTRNPGSPEMKVVLEKIYETTADGVNTVIATANHGRVNRPAIVVVNSDDDVLKRVGATPGAVGLVDVYSITGDVTVLKIGGKLPLEPGYPLHGN